MANTLKIKRGLAASIPQGQLAEPLFTTDTYDLYIGKGSGGNQRIQNYIASGTSSQFLKGDGSLDSNTYQTSLTFTSPLVNTSGTVTINQSSGSADGYLSSTDWTTFNSKEPAITAGTTLQYYRGDKTFQTLDTAVVPENGAIYFTEPRVRATVLTGLNLSGGGTIAATDSILTAFGKVQNQISALVGGATYQGTWNASTNTPTLASGTGTKGYYYVVSVAGSTNLDGITDWKVGDWAIFNGTTWDKVDNTDAVSSVNGFTGAVNLALDNISDVSAASPTNAQLLRFNGTSSLWENWTPTFEPALTKGNLTETTSSVLTITGGTGAVIGSGTTIAVSQSSGSTSGYLSSTDWTTFNSKQAQLNGTGFVKATGTTISYDNSTYLTTSDAASTYLPLTGGTLTGALSGTSATFTGDLTIDTNTLYVDSTNNKVGIRNTTPSSFSADGNTLVIGNTTDSLHGLTIATGTSGTGSILFADGTAGNAAYRGYINYFHGTGDYMTFGTSGAQRLYLDSTVFDSSVPISGTSATFSGNVSAARFTPTGSTIPTVGMYSSASNFLDFSTNGTRAITISDGQKVGIGADPISAYRLYVNGDVYASGTVYGSSASFVGTGTFGSSISATSATFSRNDAGNISVTIANAYINQGNLINFQHNTAGTTTQGYIGHGGDNTGNLVLMNNGITAVSFARATGAATFSSSVTAGTTLKVTSADTLGTNVNIINTSTGGYNWNIFSGGSDATLAPVGSLIFRDSTNGATRMVISTGGNVGIGNTSPSYSLDVSGRIRAYTGSSGVSPRTDLGGTIIAEGSTRAGLYILTSGTDSGSFGSIWWGNGNTNTDASITVNNSTRAMSFGTADGERMRITSGGNVGIGTNAPSAYGHGGTNIITEIQNSGTAANSQAHLILSTGASTNTGAIGSITFALPNSSASVKRAAVINSDITSNSSSAVYANLNFATSDGSGAATRMTITSGGNVGIGTTSPSSLLHMVGASATLIVADNTSYAAGVGGKISFQGNYRSIGDITEGGYIKASKTNATNGDYGFDMVFGTQNYTAGVAERMRITSGGYLKASPNGTYYNSTSSFSEFCNNITNGPALYLSQTNTSFTDNVLFVEGYRNTTDNTWYLISAYNRTAAAYKFRVADSGNVTNTNNSYGAISDIKLKENIIDASPKLNDLLKVSIKNFNYIGSEEKQLGVIAQDLEKIFPSMIEIHIDRDADGNDLGTKTKSVKYSVFVPMLIKAVQEQQAQIEELKSKLN